MLNDVELAESEKGEIVKFKKSLIEEKTSFEKLKIKINVFYFLPPFRIAKSLTSLRSFFGDTLIQMEEPIYNDIKSILSLEQYASLLLILDKVLLFLNSLKTMIS